MKRILLSICLLMLSTFIWAQEMEFQVNINTPKLQTADPKVFEDLENAMQAFLNNTKWTEDAFETQERIKCNIQLNIRDEISPTEFSADMQIQAVRPVYNSNYESIILSHQDKDVQFTYEQFQPLEYSRNTYRDNLTAVLSFYVYFILGLDYDTFSPFGGENYFQVAQEIVTIVPPGAAARFRGWRAVDSNRNRYWMVESVLNPRVRPFRQGMYDYHRLGLDNMHDDPESSKVIMVQVLEQIGKVDRAYPNSMILQMFSNAKTNEVIDIFKVAQSNQKSTVRRVMTKIDATNAAKYRSLGR
ncbi:MAG: DUF4835 family protein [Bacteroidota bacterium]